MAVLVAAAAPALARERAHRESAAQTQCGRFPRGTMPWLFCVYSGRSINLRDGTARTVRAVEREYVVLRDSTGEALAVPYASIRRIRIGPNELAVE